MNEADVISEFQERTEADIERIAFEQLKQIFPSVEVEQQLRARNVPSMVVDLAAHSANGRLVLFEVKHMRRGKSLSHSVYPSLAALKEVTASIAPEAPPILVLLTTSNVDNSVREILAKSGIPVVVLGANAADTKERLRNALRAFLIELPEFAPAQEAPHSEAGSCFVAISYQHEYQTIYEKAVEPAIQRAGFKPLHPAQVFSTGSLLDKISELVRSSQVVVADITNRNPNVFMEIGIAFGLGKRVVVITQDTSAVPSDLQSMSVLTYQSTPEGLDRLKFLLAESLVIIRKGLLSQTNSSAA